MKKLNVLKKITVLKYSFILTWTITLKFNILNEIPLASLIACNSSVCTKHFNTLDVFSTKETDYSFEVSYR